MHPKGNSQVCTYQEVCAHTKGAHAHTNMHSHPPYQHVRRDMQTHVLTHMHAPAHTYLHTDIHVHSSAQMFSHKSTHLHAAVPTQLSIRRPVRHIPAVLQEGTLLSSKSGFFHPVCETPVHTQSTAILLHICADVGVCLQTSVQAFKLTVLYTQSINIFIFLIFMHCYSLK